ncbi:MAG TPA: serine/threonine-protein kinase, partial [Steroidobacteraceae bacterium]
MSRKLEDLWREINSPYLDEALDLDDEARQRWLDELEGRLPAAAAAVRSSLDELERLNDIDFLGGAGPLTPTASPQGALLGRRIGAYVIDAEIGRGGMGSVWRAKRADGRFEGYVAIKFVHLSYLGNSVEQRFKLEGRLLARLNHPSIARLIDAGVLDGAHPFIVIEYVDGEPIDVYCERRALPLEDRIRIFLDVLAAVAHAHSKLVVHRDLKPSNVFVTGGGIVKLLDFGIAKLLEEGDELAELTLASPSALTPRYAAPEQLLGQPVTTATDVYTLGLLLYVLLAGVHPVSPESHSRVEQIQAVLATELPRPSLIAVGSPARRRALEGDLDNIIAKALRKSPAERYLSVSAFADDLRRFLDHEPVQARPDTNTYRLAKFLRRNRAAVLAGSLIICGLIGISSFALLQMFAARTQRDLALYREKLANAQSDLTAFTVSDTLTDASSELKRQRLDRARTFIAARFRRDPLIAGRLLIDVSGRYIEIGENKIAAEVIQEAEAIGRRTGDPEYIAQLACIRTQDLAIARDLPAARMQLAKGLSYMRRVRDVRPELNAECATAGAFVAQSNGDFAKAIALLSDAVGTLERAGLTDEGRYANTRNDLARAFLFAGNFQRAWEVES